METLQLDTTIGPDGVLRIETPTHMAPGPAKVVIVVSPAEVSVDWVDLRGVGKEIWEGIDAQAYVNQLRDEIRVLVLEDYVTAAPAPAT